MKIKRITQDLVVLGEFHPHWDQGFPSYNIDRVALWQAFLSDLFARIRYNDTLPFSSKNFIAQDVRDNEWHANNTRRFSDEGDRFDVGNWHHDNDIERRTNFGGMKPRPSGEREYYIDQWLATWANLRPTEIRMQDGSIFTAEPYEIVAWRNGTYTHRTPHMTQGEAEGRWFARCYLDPIPPPGYQVVASGPDRRYASVLQERRSMGEEYFPKLNPPLFDNETKDKMAQDIIKRFGQRIKFDFYNP